MQACSELGLISLSPNTSFQRTGIRASRGSRPLNSKRWRGAARRANDRGS